MSEENTDKRIGIIGIVIRDLECVKKVNEAIHAQPVCCRDCGPHLSVIGSGERDAEAILKTRRVIREGGIAAVKGIGGFHLCCDASNAEAVRLLRQRKHRPMKPLAVMLKNMDTVRRECLVEDGQEEILTGPQKPILLLKKKTGDGTRICRECAPDNAFVGIMPGSLI